eukprot:gene1040-11747_t
MRMTLCEEDEGCDSVGVDFAPGAGAGSRGREAPVGPDD